MNNNAIAELAVARCGVAYGMPAFRAKLAACLTLVLDHIFNEQLHGDLEFQLDIICQLEKDLLQKRESLDKLKPVFRAWARLKAALKAHEEASPIDWPSEAERILKEEVELQKGMKA